MTKLYEGFSIRDERARAWNYVLLFQSSSQEWRSFNFALQCALWVEFRRRGYFTLCSSAWSNSLRVCVWCHQERLAKLLVAAYLAGLWTRTEADDDTANESVFCDTLFSEYQFVLLGSSNGLHSPTYYVILSLSVAGGDYISGILIVQSV